MPIQPQKKWFGFLTTLLLLTCPAFLHAAPHELLHLEFDDTSSLGSQVGLPAVGSISGDLTAAPGTPSAGDFGTSGRIRFPGFVQPQGAFTVEVRFRLRNYAPLFTRYIADILGTATWTSSWFQGMTFKVGGGYLFSPLPREAFATQAEYAASLGWADDTQRAFYSRCIGQFLVASTEYPKWKAVVTDRCVDLNRWAHMVATWDGADLHMYLDGQEVTDTSRTAYAALPLHLDSAADLFVGALAPVEFGHTDGLIDFARVLDTAMGPQEIRNRYLSTLDSTERDRCRVIAEPEYPVGGLCVRGEDRFHIKKKREGNCGSGGLTPDTLDVEFSKSPLFDSIYMAHSTTDTVFQIDSAVLAGKGNESGPTYWRCRARHSGSLAKGGASAVPEPWSLPAPIMLDNHAIPNRILPSPKTKARQIMLESGRRLFIPYATHPSLPRLYSLNGTAAKRKFTACPAGWCLESDADVKSGVFLLK